MICSSPLVISEDHPSLPGHFPDNPIVPGVVILDQVIRAAQASGQQIIQVDDAKFIAPLAPGVAANIELFTCDGGMEFRVVFGRKTFVLGRLICTSRSSLRPE